MVKLKGPLQSTAASGTLAGVLTFGKTRTTHTLRKKPKPKQPNSGLQLSMRAMLQFLTREWKGLSAPNRTSWSAAPDAPDGSNYNKYLAHNLKRWRDWKAPSKSYPATETHLDAPAPSLDAQPGPRHVILTYQAEYEVRDNWAFLLYHSTTEIDRPERDKLIKLLHVETMDIQHWTHQPLAAGTHYYALGTCSIDGLIAHDLFPKKSAIVT